MHSLLRKESKFAALFKGPTRNQVIMESLDMGVMFASSEYLFKIRLIIEDARNHA